MKLLDVIGQVPSVNIRHHHIQRIPLLAEIMDTDDGRVIQAGDRLGFLHEPLLKTTFNGQVAMHHF